MTAIPVAHHEPGTVAWLDARRYAIGGSEIAAVLGLSPYESRFSLWHRKRGNAQPSTQNAEMEWGNRLEPVILDKFLELHADEYVSMGRGTFLHSERPWQTASPDHLLSYVGNNPDEVLEIKFSPFGEGWGPAGSDEYPIYYRAQVLWYLSALGLKKARLVVLISGCDYREYTIELDDEADEELAIMIAAGQEFIDSLRNDIPPSLDDHAETLQVVRELHPEIDPERVEIDANLANEYLGAVIATKQLEKDLTGLKSQMLQAMGRSREAYVDGTRVAYRKANKRPDGTPGIPYLTYDAKTVKQLMAPPSIKNARK